MTLYIRKKKSEEPLVFGFVELSKAVRDYARYVTEFARSNEVNLHAVKTFENWCRTEI
jgi:hypothetical protein